MAISHLANNSLSSPSKGGSVRNGSLNAVYNAATGGTTADVANYNGTGQTWRVHTFTSNGNFIVTDVSSTFSALVVAGGGDGTLNYVGGVPTGTTVGGGAGGMLTDTALTLVPTTYAVVVGVNGRPGGTSSFHTISTTGGGGGRYANSGGGNAGINGGSGGGGTGDSGGLAGGTGISGQGYAGGAGTNNNGGSGGGAGGAGVTGGNGGVGRASTITGSSVTYAIGGTRNSGTVGRANMGDGGGGNAAGSVGVVIIAYQIAA